MADVVSLLVTHSELQSFCPELRFVLSRTIAEVKAQLSGRCGTDAQSMNLVLKDDGHNTLYSTLEDDKPLGYYSPYEGYIIHVMDLNPMSSGWLEDVSQVEKYVMPDEEYDKRDNTFRAFKKRLGGEMAMKIENDIDVRCDINTGDRCQIDPGDKRGSVRFVGPIPQLKRGIWIGIEYDEPVGKNDGTVGGERYFTCPALHGAFVRPTRVRVGDFPPFDTPFDDEI